MSTVYHSLSSNTVDVVLNENGEVVINGNVDVISVTKEQKEEYYYVISKQVLSSYWKYSLVNILQKYANSANSCEDSCTVLCSADVAKYIDADSWSKLLQVESDYNSFPHNVTALYKRFMPQQELPNGLFQKMTAKESNTLRVTLLIFSTQYQEKALKTIHLSQEVQWKKQLHEKKQQLEKKVEEHKSDEENTETKVLSLASLNLASLNLAPLKLFSLKPTHVLVAVTDFKMI